MMRLACSAEILACFVEFPSCYAQCLASRRSWTESRTAEERRPSCSAECLASRRSRSERRTAEERRNAEEILQSCQSCQASCNQEEALAARPWQLKLLSSLQIL